MQWMSDLAFHPILRVWPPPNQSQGRNIILGLSTSIMSMCEFYGPEMCTVGGGGGGGCSVIIDSENGQHP